MSLFGLLSKFPVEQNVNFSLTEEKNVSNVVLPFTHATDIH